MKLDNLHCETDYYRAQKTLESLLKNGLILRSEFDKITLLNRKTFCPMYADIMPNHLDIIPA